MRVGNFYSIGEASAFAQVLSEPISFWGGVEPKTGDVIDRSHADYGVNIAGKILVMHSGRGSSSSSSVLAEMIRRGTAPAGLLLALPDPILTVGAIVAQSLYGLSCPIVVCPIDGIVSGNQVSISRDDTGAALVRVVAQGFMESRVV